MKMIDTTLGAAVAGTGMLTGTACHLDTAGPAWQPIDLAPQSAGLDLAGDASGFATA